MAATRQQLDGIFARLEAAYDYSAWHWQPDTALDYICISAILVQHTNWLNVKRALERLDAAGAMSLETISGIAEETLAELVRPAGTPLVKARRLLSLAALFTEHNGVEVFLSGSEDPDLRDPDLRAALLSTHGVGPETADAILLFAAGRLVFVIDEYTIRLFRRLGVGPERNGYDAWQRWFESALPQNVDAYRRWHGLIVLHGKQTCRPKPKCESCCLREVCATGRAFDRSGG